jgi:phage terminase large subunit-like protein
MSSEVTMNTQGQRVSNFIESFVTLGGSFLGDAFELLPFQREIIDDIYRTDDDGKRLHRTYLLGLPRKNGKSQLAAALAIYHLIADDADKSPLVVCAAGSRDQARLVFQEVQRCIKSSPDLSEVCQVFRNEVKCDLNNGVLKVLSADHGINQGLNPSFVVIDEYHIHKNRELFDALTLGSATRNQPLTLVISTAGFDLDSPLGEIYRYGRKIESGEVKDPSFGFTWFGPTDHETFDHSDPEAWRRFNPAFDDFMNQDEMESAFNRTHESAFIRYRCNGWTATDNAWLESGVFDNLKSDRKLLPGEQIVIGVDAAWKNDASAIVACTVDGYHLEILGLWEKPDTAGGHGMGWRTPVQEIKETIIEACDNFRVVEIACDPFRLEETIANLAAEGLPIVEYPTNSTTRMTQCTQNAYDKIIGGEISHNGDPALIRHFNNAVLREDPKRGSRLTKERRNSSKKIDACIASIIALHRASFYEPEAEQTEAQLIVI